MHNFVVCWSTSPACRSFVSLDMSALKLPSIGLPDVVVVAGDCINDEEFNQKISPLFHIDNIRAPLLIGQGANDPRYHTVYSSGHASFLTVAQISPALPKPGLSG